MSLFGSLPYMLTAENRRRAVCLTIGLATVPLGLLASCSKADTDSVSRVDRQGDKLQIVTTFLPITDFTLAVAGDRAQVTQLIPSNVSPHDYQAKPQDVQRVAQADVLIENGLDVESFLAGLIDSANNPDLTWVDSSEGIAAIPLEPQSHESSALHSHGEFDPHIWLDPKKAMQQVVNIRDALISVDPAGTDVYTANANAYIRRLQALDRETSRALSPYAGQTLVSYHDFADHFAQSYDLQVEHIVDVPEDSATPADMQRVIKATEGSDLKILLSESSTQNRLLESLAKDMNLQISQFDPIESSGPDGFSADYYLSAMERNLANLKAAIAQSPP